MKPDPTRNNRILVIDDDPAIHGVFRKILTNHDPLQAAAGRHGKPETPFQIDFALQGAEGLSLVQQAVVEGRPYSMAFVDVHMPQGWDGIETTRRIWEVYPDLQVVLCTGYSDYSWNELSDVVGQPNRLLILKKPFDSIEVVQLAHALTDKWRLLQESKQAAIDLEQAASERTARNLQESEQRYRFLAEAMPEITWTARADGTLDYYNKRWYDYTGLTVDQTQDWGWQLVLHPDDLKNCVERWTDSFTTGCDFEVEYRFKRAADGAYRWFLGRAVPMRNEQDTIVQWVGTCTDIDDYKRGQESLLEAQANLERRVVERTTELDVAKMRLQAVLNAATHVSIIATDAAGLIVVFNSGAERMLGYRADEMVGVQTPESFHDPAQCLERSRQMTADHGRPVEGFDVFVANARERPFDEREWIYVRKDGRKLDVSLIVTAVRNADGVVDGYLGIATDITQRKRLITEIGLNHEKLAEQTRRAEEANRAKSDFLATMSHEIRTPMNGVVGMTELLLLTDLSKEQRNYAELVLSSADSLLTVINDILDFSKVESGKMHLEAIDFALRTSIEEVADLLAARAQSKGVEMACLIQQNLPSVVQGDPGRLRQILTNLLGNAIKFTQAGEVVLRAKLAEETDETVTVRFEITDTGIGISHEGRSRLFQSFSQADSSTTRQFGGTGLGLAISKRLAELMGGDIGVASELGKGSTFWFTVKLRKTPASHVVVPPSREDLRGLSVLAVDDNLTNLQLVSAQARAWGMECDTTTRGAEALQMIDAASGRRPYDVAILDMQMPGMDGLELAETIKRDPSNGKMKLVLMTSMAQRSHATRSEQIGIGAYLTKPVRQSQLYDTLRTVLGPSSQSSPKAVEQTLEAATPHAVEGSNESQRLRVLLAEDNRTNQVAAVLMLEMLGYPVQVVANGLEAVEACRNGNYGVVLMDNQMPEMDGLTAAREIRKFELANGKPAVPIIALTANAMQGDREKCLAAGMNDYLSKPFKVVQLRQMLERWGHLSPAVAPAPEAIPPVRDERAIDSRVFDEFRAAGTAGAANDFVTKLIDQYLAESTSRMADVNDAVERRDAPALRFATHSLKGASSTVGANRMAGMCEELEALARNTTFDGTPALVIALGDEFERVRLALQVEQGLAD